MADVAVRILLSVAGGGAVVNAITSVTKSLGASALTGAIVAVGVTSAIAFGVTAVKAAGDFQSSLTTLVTGAGEVQSNIGLISDGILNMAVATGTSTKQLTDGLFMIESAGYHGQAGLDVLKTAAEGAKVGNADLGTTADAVTTIMKDYGIKASNSADAMNFLISVVSNGKTHMQDLAGAMSSVLPTASAVGVQLKDVGGAMATMTSEGVPAANAATYLRQMLISLAAPASAGKKSLADIGLTTTDVSNSMKKSLPDTLKMIMDHLKTTYKEGSPEYVNALKNIAGGSKQMQGMLDLTGTHLKDFGDNVKNVSGTVDKGKGSVVGWSLVQGDFNFKMSQIGQILQTGLIKAGLLLLPVLTNLATVFINIVTGAGNVATAVGNVVNAMKQGQPAALALLIPLGALAGVLVYLGVQAVAAFIAAAPAMIAGFVDGAVAAWGMAAGVIAATWPFILIGAAIGLVIAIIILLWTHWSQVSAWLQGAWKTTAKIATDVWNDVASFFQMIWGKIVGFFQTYGLLIIAIILSIFTGGLAILVYLVITHWSQIKDFITKTWDNIRNGVGNFFSALGTLVQKGLQAVKQFFINIFNDIVGVFKWLYDHNYYFKNLVDTIKNIITAGLTWVKNAWNTAVTDLTNLWNTISGFAKKAWQAVSDAVTAVITTIVNWVKDKWNTSVTDLTNLWNTISGTVSKAWQAVSDAVMSKVNGITSWIKDQWNTAISNLSDKWNTLKDLMNTAWGKVSSALSGAWGTYITGPLGDIWNKFSKWFGDLAGKFGDWAKNLLTSFINGLMSKLGDLKNSLQNIGSTIAGWLGFHSPTKEGPGKELDQWPRNMMNTYAKGLTDAIPTLQIALNAVAKPIASSLGGGNLPASATGGILRSQPAPAAGSGTVITINLSTMARTPQEISRTVDLFEAELARRFRAQTPGYNQGNIY